MTKQIRSSFSTLLVAWSVFLILNIYRAFADSYKGHNANNQKPNATWIVNKPAWFQQRNHNIELLRDVRGNTTKMELFTNMIQTCMSYVDSRVDGEIIDVVEHFFWGRMDGIAMELGALDGSRATASMTVDMEEYLGWKRILIEGNPRYKAALLNNSAAAYSVNAAICSQESKVHFIDAEYVGGIAEFMAQKFIQSFHGYVYNAGQPSGNLASVDWSKFSNIVEIDCVHLSRVLQEVHTRHINFFILDAEGGELSVLHSIPWHMVKFDVICVEVEPDYRPPGYAHSVTTFLQSKGYVDASGFVGRNIWYIRHGFVPSVRPGLAADCYNGMQKARNMPLCS